MPTRKNIYIILGITTIALLATGSGLLSTTATAQTSTITSYCGTPDFFDQFAEQEGYSLTERCTGVQVQDYRIDVSKDSYNEGWGCFADYTVYKNPDGNLEQVAEGDEGDNINVEGLEIQTKAASGFSYYNCDYIRTDYTPSFDGELTYNLVSPGESLQGETAQVEVVFNNTYSHRVTGDASARFCTDAPFGSQCTSSSTDLNIAGDSVKYKTFTVDTSDVEGSINVQVSSSGLVLDALGSWEGVNLDCNQDGTQEPVEDCNGLPMQGGSESGTIEVVEDNRLNRANLFLDSVFEDVKTVIANVFGGAP